MVFFVLKKNLQKMSIITWSTLFKNGNNLYEHWNSKTTELHRPK